MTTQAPAATTVDSLSKDPSRRARFAEFWYYFSENRGAVIGLWFFVFLVVLAVFAPSSRRTLQTHRIAPQSCCRHSGRKAATRPICSAPTLSVGTFSHASCTARAIRSSSASSSPPSR
jgi:hypothetical protein